MKMILWFASGVALLALMHSSAAAATDYQVRFVEANPEAGFNFPYYLRTPNPSVAAEPSVLIVESNNSGVHDDFQVHIDAVAKHIAGRGPGPEVADTLNQPLLIPVFPRTKDRWQLYTHALDRDSILIEDDALERVDLQLLRMVENAQSRLREGGGDVASKFVLVGFSASGTFSNRFAFLHPGRLLAVVSGAVNAFPMLPVPELRGRTLNFPLGTSDLQSFTGRPFDVEVWKNLPQFIFMGAADENDALKYDDAYSERERTIVFRVLAEPMAERWAMAQAVYLEKKPNIKFATYGQVGHWTDRRVNRDISSFVKTEIERASAKHGT